MPSKRPMADLRSNGVFQKEGKWMLNLTGSRSDSPRCQGCTRRGLQRNPFFLIHVAACNFANLQGVEGNSARRDGPTG